MIQKVETCRPQNRILSNKTVVFLTGTLYYIHFYLCFSSDVTTAMGPPCHVAIYIT